MGSKVFTFMFDCDDFYHLAVEQIPLARAATAALHGGAAVRLETFAWEDSQYMEIQVDASTEVSRAMLLILISQLDYLIGDQEFSVCQSTSQDVFKIDQWKESGLAC